MLKKRIIPCLDIKDGRTVKGVNFVSLQDAGDPVELAREYVKQGADELVFLDITATIEGRGTLISLVREVAGAIDIPFTVGGGIHTADDAAALIRAGADKVSINSSAVKNPELISQIASRFGRQCVVVAIDGKWMDHSWQVMVHGGRTPVGRDVLDWAVEAESRGAGEILFTSMMNDGTRSGFAIDMTAELSRKLNIPVIASGGAGSMKDFADVFSQTRASGALAASVFHFGEIGIPELKIYLKNQLIPVR